MKRRHILVRCSRPLQKAGMRIVFDRLRLVEQGRTDLVGKKPTVCKMVLDYRFSIIMGRSKK